MEKEKTERLIKDSLVKMEGASCDKNEDQTN